MESWDDASNKWMDGQASEAWGHVLIEGEHVVYADERFR